MLGRLSFQFLAPEDREWSQSLLEVSALLPEATLQVTSEWQWETWTHSWSSENQTQDENFRAERDLTKHTAALEFCRWEPWGQGIRIKGLFKQLFSEAGTRTGSPAEDEDQEFSTLVTNDWEIERDGIKYSRESGGIERKEK